MVYRQQRGVPFLEQAGCDLHFAFRQHRSSPGYTLAAILTLALGIGANTSMFTVEQGVLLSPLPYDQPDRPVVIWRSQPNVKHVRIYPQGSWPAKIGM
jgi:hypothetical protein